MANESVAVDPKPRLIKLFFKVEDHVRLKLAAVMSDQGVGDFCREVIMAKAREMTKGIQVPARSSNGSVRMP